MGYGAMAIRMSDRPNIPRPPLPWLPLCLCPPVYQLAFLETMI